MMKPEHLVASAVGLRPRGETMRPWPRTFLAISVALAFAVPATSATPGLGNITRSFDQTAIFFDFESGGKEGTGVYDPANDENPCNQMLSGLKTPSSSAFTYYSTLRIATNSQAFIPIAGELMDLNLGVSCPLPLPAGTAGNLFLRFGGVNLDFYDSLFTDIILCQRLVSALGCLPVPGSQVVYATACNWANTAFGPSVLGDGKSFFSPAEAVFGSRYLGCPGGWTHSGGTSHDYSHTFTTFELGRAAMGFDDIKNVDLVHNGDGSGYAVVCVTIDYVELDTVAQQTASAHDWKLILDVGTPADWAAAIQKHLLNNPAGTLPSLPGLYDLSGDNGFACPGLWETHAKDKSSPILPGTEQQECSDGSDNDNDGTIDHPEDAGCTSALDDSESPDPQCLVRDGFDLFETEPSVTSVGILGLLTPVHFEGIPIGPFDFGGSIGTQDVGITDTIVHHSSASRDVPVSVVTLAKLQLRGVEHPSFFVTLQSDRGSNPLDPPDGPPSEGLLALSFDPGCSRGTFHSTINVNFDVRLGALDGPIVGGGSFALSTEDTPWSRDGSLGACMIHPEAVSVADRDLLARHGICGPSASIPGVNKHLNGADSSDDFFPGEEVRIHPPGHLAIHRLPVGMPPTDHVTRLVAAPTANGWTCVDTHTGIAVVAGDSLAGPNPSVACTPPPGPNECQEVDAGGLQTDAGFGTLEVTSACGALAATQLLALPSNNPEASQSSDGAAPFPWVCSVDESGLLVPPEPDYTVFCNVNAPTAQDQGKPKPPRINVCLNAVRFPGPPSAGASFDVKFVEATKDYDYERPQWKDTNCDQKSDKNFPLVYKRATKMAAAPTITIKFFPPLPEGGTATVKVKGEILDYGLSMKNPNYGTMTFNFADRVISGYEEFGWAPSEADKALIDSVQAVDALKIVWTIKVTTTDGRSFDETRQTLHTLYAVYDTPTVSPLYFDLVDISSRAAHGETTVAGIVQKTWEEFADKKVEKRTFDRVKGVAGEGPVMTFYGKEPVGNPPECFTTHGLLQTLDGRCSAWAELLNDVWKAQGFSGRILRLTPNEGSLKFAMATYTFTDLGSTDCVGSHTYDKDVAGEVKEVVTPAQGGVPKRHLFGDHAVVQSPAVLPKHLYDPSYGTDFDDLKKWEDGDLGKTKTKSIGAWVVLNCYRENTDTGAAAIEVASDPTW